MTTQTVEPVSVDFASYQADPAFSASDLKLITKQNARALWHYKFNEYAPPRLPTPAMKFGTMLHAACLEPDVFYDKFKIVENKRTKEGLKPNLPAHHALTPKNCFSRKFTRFFIFF